MKTDLEIRKNVIEELQWRPTLQAARIGVAVRKGVVTLSGTVNSHGQKRDAENAALAIEGVCAVAQDLHIKLQPGARRTDTELVQAALDTLRWNTLVPGKKIRLRVEDGWITIEGTVDWMYEKNAVRNSLSRLTGVKGITNLVTVSPKVDTAGLKERIRHAFERHARVDAGKIRIESNGHKVTLTGTVRSYAEFKEAEKVAMNAPGVGQVVNELQVKIPSCAAV